MSDFVGPLTTLAKEPLPQEEPTAADVDRQKRDAKKRLWAAGVLSWKFKEYPWAKEMYDFTRAHWGEQVHWLVHRRGTKSSTGIVLGLEECLREPNTSIAIVTKTKEQAQEIIDESLLPLLEDCPVHLQPRRIKNDYKYVFDHNGSKIVILPTDQANFRKGRGRKFKYILITEAGFIDKLDVVVASVLAPTTRDVLGNWQGTIVMESTPPEEDGHPWIAMYAAAEFDGRAYYLPLSKNKWASPLFVKQCQEDCGGVDTVIYQREYECKFVQDEDNTVVPEFTADKAFGGPTPMVREIERPQESDLYVSMDTGGRDLTAALFAFYHFEKNLIVIEDELALLNMTSDDLALKVKGKEKELWGEKPDGRLMRIADNNNVILLYDLQRLHQLRFWATAKDNKDAQINLLRLMVRDNLLAINPRCRLLIKTLRLAKRAKQARKGFEHGAEIGHADLLDALIYLIRNVRKAALPKAPTMRTVEQGVVPPQPKRSSSGDALVRALGLGRR